MAWQDDIAQKRQQQQQEQAAKRLHSESVDAVKTNSKEVVASTKSLAKSTDIDSLIQQVKDVQLAVMLIAKKPPLILPDHNDLGDKMGELADKVQAAIRQLDSTETDRQQIAELKSLYIGLSQLKRVFSEGNTDLRNDIELLTKAVNSINVAPVVNVPAPVVNVPAPHVTVDAPKLDLKPLQDTLEGYFKSSDDADIDLECYRAQDIIESGDMQYVGFVNSQGKWYIIENDIKANSIRYVFGDRDYAKAFKKASSYRYSLLNEAVNALSA